MKEMVPTVRILDIPFSIMGMDETVQYCEDLLQTDKCHQIVTANPEIVMLAQADAKLKNILEQAQLVTCDGTGIVWASRFTDFSAKERVAGYDLTLRLLSLCEDKELSVYFIGAKPDVIEQAIKAIERRWPKLQIEGYHHGYLQAGDELKICEDIRQKRPTILFVAFGAPRQEYWIADHLQELQVPLAMGIGGSLDVLAGAVKRAPVFWQKIHLEWLYRLLKQPSRWRRMLLLPKFVYCVLKNKKSDAKFVRK